jgi:hypothetical protein
MQELLMPIGSDEISPEELRARQPKYVYKAPAPSIVEPHDDDQTGPPMLPRKLLVFDTPSLAQVCSCRMIAAA